MGWREKAERITQANYTGSGWRSRAEPVPQSSTAAGDEPGLAPRQRKGAWDYTNYLADRAVEGAYNTVGFVADLPAHVMNTDASYTNEHGRRVLPFTDPMSGAQSEVTMSAPPMRVPTPVQRWANDAFHATTGRTEEDMAPQSDPERYGGRAAEFVGAGLPLAPFLGPTGALVDAGIGTGQGLVYEGVKDATGNEAAAALSSLAAPLAPGALAGAARATLGGGSRRMAPALADAAAVPGYRPSAADAGGSDIAMVAERAGSYTLGSRGTVRKRAEANDAALQREAERIATAADRIGGLRSARTERGAQAGEAIRKGLNEDTDSWFRRSLAEAEAAEAKAGAEISAASGGRPVWVNVAPLLPRLRAAALRQGEWGGVDNQVSDLAQRLVARAGGTGGLVPLESVIRLKTRLGEGINWAGATPGADAALYRGLYGETAEQITQAVARLGSPAAVRAWKHSQQLWNNRFERVRNYLDPVEAQKATPERIVNSVLAIGTPSRASALRRMVGERRWNQVRAYTIRRMGQSKPSAIEGVLAPGADDIFSPQTFATNWNAMKQSGHLETIFGGRSDRAWAALRPELDRLARVADRIQRTRRSMYNSSGSASSGLPVAQATSLGGAIAAAPFVGPVPLLTVIGGMTGVGVTSRMMMSPRFVRWLSTDGEIPWANLATAIARLNQVILAEKDATTRMEMVRFRDALVRQPPPATAQ